MSRVPTSAASRDELQQTIWHRRMKWLRRWIAVSCLALVASTWKLWTPQTVFPQIPFLAALRTAPAWLDWVGLGTLVIALVAMLVLTFINRRRPAAAGRDARGSLSSPPLASAPSREREGLRAKAATLLFVAALTLLVLLDQHRFQPWAYQFAIVAIVLAFAPAGRAASLLRVLTVGIYFWSAYSKFDTGFLRTTGPDLLESLLGWGGINPRGPQLEALAILFPVAELAIAFLLSIRALRTFGLGMAICMHLGLLLALGPLGLKSAAGVLLWNLYFIGQDLLLFWRPPAGWHGAAGPGDGRFRLHDLKRGVIPVVGPIGVASLTVALAVWLPALEPSGLLDHWPAWAVYTSRGERVNLLLYMPKERVPQELRRFLMYRGFDGHYVFRTDLWSLEALNAPLYPQERFRVGAALGLLNRYRLENYERGDYAVLVSKSRPEPHDWMPGVAAIREYASSFRLNALPRKLGGW